MVRDLSDINVQYDPIRFYYVEADIAVMVCIFKILEKIFYECDR